VVVEVPSRPSWDADLAWPSRGRTLVVLPDAGLLPRCLRHLGKLTAPEVHEVVVAMPEQPPMWWALAVAAGIPPAGVEPADLRGPQELAIALLLGRHPEHDGLTVRCLPPGLAASAEGLLHDGGFTKAVVVMHGQASLRARLLRRRLERRCPARLAALPA
jgi:hypothetical protein